MLTALMILVISVLLVAGLPNPPTNKAAQVPSPKSGQQQQAKSKDSKKNNKQPVSPPAPASKPPTPSKNVLQKQADEAKKKDPNSPDAKKWQKEADNYNDKHGPYQMQESKHDGLGDGYKYDPKTGKLAQSTYANEQRIKDRRGLPESTFYDGWPGYLPRAEQHRELGERESIRYNQGEKGSSKEAVNGHREKESIALNGVNGYRGTDKIPHPDMLPK